MLEKSRIKPLRGFFKRLNWFMENRKDLASRVRVFLLQRVAHQIDACSLVFRFICGEQQARIVAGVDSGS